MQQRHKTLPLPFNDVVTRPAVRTMHIMAPDHGQEEVFVPVGDDYLVKGRGVPPNFFDVADKEAAYARNFSHD